MSEVPPEQLRWLRDMGALKSQKGSPSNSTPGHHNSVVLADLRSGLLPLRIMKLWCKTTGTPYSAAGVEALFDKAGADLMWTKALQVAFFVFSIRFTLHEKSLLMAGDEAMMLRCVAQMYYATGSHAVVKKGLHGAPVWTEQRAAAFGRRLPALKVSPQPVAPRREITFPGVEKLLRVRQDEHEVPTMDEERDDPRKKRKQHLRWTPESIDTLYAQFLQQLKNMSLSLLLGDPVPPKSRSAGGTTEDELEAFTLEDIHKVVLIQALARGICLRQKEPFKTFFFSKKEKEAFFKEFLRGLDRIRMASNTHHEQRCAMNQMLMAHREAQQRRGLEESWSRGYLSYEEEKTRCRLRLKGVIDFRRTQLLVIPREESQARKIIIHGEADDRKSLLCSEALAKSMAARLRSVCALMIQEKEARTSLESDLNSASKNLLEDFQSRLAQEIKWKDQYYQRLAVMKWEDSVRRRLMEEIELTRQKQFTTVTKNKMMVIAKLLGAGSQSPRNSQKVLQKLYQDTI